MNYLKLFSPYTFNEKILILKYLFNSKILGNKKNITISKELRATFHLTNYLIKNGIRVKKLNGFLLFDYIINSTSLRFELKKESSDALVFSQIIIYKEFESVLEIINDKKIIINNMIDAGANIGLTSIFFKTHFPEVNVIALEPSTETFKRLENNITINNLKNVELLNKGIWSKNTKLKGDKSFGDQLDWAFRLIETEEDSEALFEAVSIAYLLKNNKYLDFLKIDIEGGEVEVFKDISQLDWLNYIKVITIEIHDEFDCRNHIEQILIDYNFDLKHSGELTIGINKNIIDY